MSLCALSPFYKRVFDEALFGVSPISSALDLDMDLDLDLDFDDMHRSIRVHDLLSTALRRLASADRVRTCRKRKACETVEATRKCQRECESKSDAADTASTASTASAAINATAATADTTTTTAATGRSKVSKPNQHKNESENNNKINNNNATEQTETETATATATATATSTATACETQTSRTTTVCERNAVQQFEASANVADFDPSEVQVKQVGNRLVITAAHETRNEAEGERTFVRRQLTRTYTVPEDVDSSKIEAKLGADGVLRVTAPRLEKEAAKGRMITIERDSSE